MTRRSWILVDFPSDGGAPPIDRKEWEDRAFGRAYLCPLNDEQVIDWEVDDRGELEWALVHHCDTRRRSIDSARGAVIIETWTYWTRDRWQRWTLKYEFGKRPDGKTDVPLDSEGDVATKGRVPLIRVELPDELWAMNLIADAQLEQTRKRNALSWGMDRTCFAMRIFKLKEPPSQDGTDSAGGGGPKQGPGYGMIIGVDEEITWDAPPSEAFTPIADYAAKLKDEIYRVTHQMALGVDNSAAAIGRSGESKNADNAATTIVARALGGVVRSFTKQVLDLVALGRSEAVTWTVAGMDKYVAVDTVAVIDTAVKTDTVNVPSPTFRRENAKRTAFALLPDASPELRATIAKEIDANITDDDIEPKATKAPPPDVDDEAEDDDTEELDEAAEE